MQRDEFAAAHVQARRSTEAIEAEGATEAEGAEEAQGAEEARDVEDTDDFVDGDLDSEGGFDLAADEEPPALDEGSQRILAFEQQWWRRPGAKEQAIRDTFGLTPTRYYQLLNALLDDPLALAHDPVLVQRLRRLRATRTRGH